MENSRSWNIWKVACGQMWRLFVYLRLMRCAAALCSAHAAFCLYLSPYSFARKLCHGACARAIAPAGAPRLRLLQLLRLA